MTEPSFAIVTGHPQSPLVIHVPHAATAIPHDVREGIVLDDDALTVEVDHMTDAHTDHLASLAVRHVAPRPWMFINRLSRLVVDPERLPDDQEEMASVGMGMVYRTTSHGSVLRDPDPQRDLALRRRFFDPYAEALADLVDDRLSTLGQAVIVDLHSYPRQALPYELHGHTRRPPVCLGTDAFHTPPHLIQAATNTMQKVGEVRVNEPFAGTYVPLRHFDTDPRVQSIMIELRRDTYMHEPGGGLSDDAEAVAEALAAFISEIGVR